MRATHDQHGRDRRHDDCGAGLVEFALVLPVLVTLVLGIFTGGLAYQRKQSMTHAARESSRFAATLPIANYAAYDDPADPADDDDPADEWLRDVAELSVDSSSGELTSTAPERYLCAAYVYPNGTAARDRTRRLVINGTAESFDGGTCFSDNRPNTERRVQVLARRSSKLEALLFSMELELTGKAVSRFEASPT